MQRAAERTGASSIVVYTAITGHYDRLKEQPANAMAGGQLVAFLDEPKRSRTWQMRAIHTEFDDPVRNAKIHKILSHRYFPEARYSLWIDGSVTIQFAFRLAELVDRYLIDCDLAVFRHRIRNCVYQEAGECLLKGLDDPAVIWKQIGRYMREGYPANAGLAECTVLLRRHTPAVQEFNEAWWGEILHGSKRDQLSFPYVARKLGLRYQMFPGDLARNALFQRAPHRGQVEPRVSRRAARARSHRSWLTAAIQATMILARSSIRRQPRTVPAWLAPTALPPSPHTTHVAGGVGSGPFTETWVRRPRSAPAGRKTIAFGPIRDLPSWSWVGFDTARELAKYYDIATYHAWSEPPKCDVLFAIKERPPDHFVERVLDAQTPLVYCPIDRYQDHAELERDGAFLRACAMVVAHCERLVPLLQSHCDNTRFVDHHTRYALSRMAEYKSQGYVLWIGGCQYLPYLVRWLEHHPIAGETCVLTDIDNYRARHAARVTAARLGMRFGVYRSTNRVAGCGVYQWSEGRQEAMMRECKAALDIKMTAAFEQAYKPPTKAQQFVASGIAFAANPDSYSAEYFRLRGFDVVSPADPARWFSREYWEGTRVFGEQLRAATSLEVVGRRYRDLIESL